VSVREIVTAGHPVLRERAREISPDELQSSEIQALIDDLIDTMRFAGGAGLAANQIAEPVRVAVVEVTPEHPRYPYKPPIPLTVIVNATIEPIGSDTIEINEGCLSVPGLRGVLARWAAVRVRYLDRRGEAQVGVWRGLSAGTFQHEVDHLDGILFLDRVSDPRTFMTWESFDRFHRDSFVARVAELPR
jgi:peptide deformylase